MKLYTLGTSAGSSVKERSCSVNVIEAGGNLYIFDCGGNIEEQFVNMQLPFHNIKAVFITHMHRDHVQSLPGILYRAELSSRDSVEKKEKLDVFLPEEKGVYGLKIWLDSMYMKKTEAFLNYFVVGDGVIYKDDFITVTAISTKHIDYGQNPSFAYKIEGEGKRFIYTGDLCDTFEDYPSVIFKEDFDCVLCELSHLNIQNNLNTIINSKTKKMIFTHVDFAHISDIESVKDEIPFEITVASDGMCFEI